MLAQVRSKQGQRLEEIGRALRMDTGVLKYPIANLLSAKKLKTTGAKRGTKYFVR
jgi:predicted transcriptional regulator